MKIKTIISLVVLCISPIQLAQAKSVQVLKVVDGDTVRVLKDGQKVSVRLYGIDAPEKKQKYGAESTRKLERLLEGKKVELEEVNKDRYGRTVGILYVNSKDINKRMLEGGHAYYYGQYCKNKTVCSSYSSAEGRAKVSKKGVWGIKGMQLPSQWRKENK